MKKLYGAGIVLQLLEEGKETGFVEVVSNIGGELTVKNTIPPHNKTTFLLEGETWRRTFEHLGEEVFTSPLSSACCFVEVAPPC